MSERGASRRIVLGADSASGHLAVDLVGQLRATDEPVPAGVVFSGQAHVFQAFAGLIPEARRALSITGRFVRASLSTGERSRPLEGIS